MFACASTKYVPSENRARGVEKELRGLYGSLKKDNQIQLIKDAGKSSRKLWRALKMSANLKSQILDDPVHVSMRSTCATSPRISGTAASLVPKILSMMSWNSLSDHLLRKESLACSGEPTLPSQQGLSKRIL
jgi:hypothetical protein